MKDRKRIYRQQNKEITRRDFMASAAAAAAFTIVPRYVLGGPGHTPPSEKLNIAGIGIGGMGKTNLKACATENIVALCDVDDSHAAEVYKTYPNARQYRDFRKMLEKQKDIDAVIVATPDHTHAAAAMTAIKMGKHVYCQKPLTRTIYEARKLTEAAREHKVATQMGNQGHSGEGIRLTCEWIWDGAIGPVREVHAWTDRPLGWWLQGIDRPKDTPAAPATLDWDLWLGPAPYRPYHPCYHPFKWRGWVDFGCGALGDMACHIMDPTFWALKLGSPTSVEASSTLNIKGQEYNFKEEKVITNPPGTETYPVASIVHYKFPARGDMPPVKVTWYDGGLMPPRPDELEPGREMAWGDAGGGVLFIGDKGKLMCGNYGNNPRLMPEAKMKEYKLPPKTIPRIEGSHEQDWVRACKGGKAACSNFDYSGPFTEAVLLGNLAILTGEKLDWDGANMKVTNLPKANEYVHRQYRQGWCL